MKLINNIALSALAAASLAACTDGNDWTTDAALSRLFGVDDSKIAVEPGISTAELTFAAQQGAEYYIVEVSTDSLYDDVPMGGTANSIVFGKEKQITKTPFTLTGLKRESQYFLRMKSMADGKNESRWVYYKSHGTFKTLFEQIFEPLTAKDILDTYIDVHWTSSEVDRLLVTQTVVTNPETGATEERVVLDKTLTADEAVALAYRISGLTGGTEYTITIWNKGEKRGELKQMTAAPMPDGDLKYILTDDDEYINNALLNQLVAESGLDAPAIAIGVPAGKTVTLGGLSEAGEPAALKIPEGVSLTIFGMPGGNKPVLEVEKSLAIDGAHTYIKFQNLVLTERNGGNYFIKQGNACNIGEIVFDDCVIKDWGNSVVRLQSSAAKVINKLVFENCLVSNISKSNGYLAIHVDASKNGVINNIECHNTTFYNFDEKNNKGFIYSKSTPMESILMSNCTFRNILRSGGYFIDFGDTSTGCSKDITIENTLFGRVNAKDTRGIRSSNVPVVNNSYNTLELADGCYWHKDADEKDNPKTASFFEGLTTLSVSDADVFKDAASGDFTLKNDELISAKVGDLRWIK